MRKGLFMYNLVSWLSVLCNGDHTVSARTNGLGTSQWGELPAPCKNTTFLVGKRKLGRSKEKNIPVGMDSERSHGAPWRDLTRFLDLVPVDASGNHSEEMGKLGKLS